MSTRAERRPNINDKSACIQVNLLSKRFGTVKAVRDVTFDVYPGQIVALIGANGSGKSTLLRMLYGLCRPETGEIYIYGIDPTRKPKALYAVARFLSQQLSLDSELTGDETLKFFASLYGVPKPQLQQEMDIVVRQFGLGDFCSRRISAWSGGMKQRLHLALCALGDSKLMLLDEPTSNLDPTGSIDFWSHCKKYSNNNGTVVLSTHDLKNANLYASRVILLDKGRVILDESPEKIRQQFSRPVVFATLAENGLAEQVRENLKSLPSVVEVDCHDRQLAIVLEDDRSKDAAIVNELEQQGVAVESYRRESGLAAAYYILAGQPLAITAPSKKRQHKGGAGRRQ